MSEPLRYEVWLPFSAIPFAWEWLRNNDREAHFVETQIGYPVDRHGRGFFVLVLNNRDTALLLKLALA